MAPRATMATHASANQNSGPSGRLARMSSEGRAPPIDDAATIGGVWPGTVPARVPPRVGECTLCSVGIDHSRVTRGSTTVNRKSMMNWSTT